MARMADVVPMTKSWYRDGTRGDFERWSLHFDGSAKYHYNRGHDVFGEEDRYKEGTFTLRSLDETTAEAVITWMRAKTERGNQPEEWSEVNTTETLEGIPKSELV